MKILVLNLPYHRKIIRKYSCSYYANGFLYPPIELVRLATIIKEKSSDKTEVLFTDAIAEGLNFSKCKEYLNKIRPDIIVSLASVDFINDEYAFLKDIKKSLGIPIVFIGYLPELLPKIFSEADVILGNNFEQVFAKVCENFDGFTINEFIHRLNISKSEKLVFDPDVIEKHDNSFLCENLYSELFAKGKTAFTYFSFGCPYKCTFCIKTYNLKNVFYRNIDNIIIELEDYWESGIRNVRILDDNCTLNKSLLQELLTFQRKNRIQFNYHGLTRIDLLDDETIDLIIKLGFKSILIGIETISAYTQNAYKKTIDLDLEKTKQKLQVLKKGKVEVSIFILFNPITESKSDINKTLKYLKKLPVHFASLSYLKPYPGTVYFENNKEHIEISETPEYYSQLKSHYYDNLWKNEFLFMFSFYFLNPKNLIYLTTRLIRHPKQSIIILLNSIKFLFYSDRNRRDYF